VMPIDHLMVFLMYQFLNAEHGIRGRPQESDIRGNLLQVIEKLQRFARSKDIRPNPEQVKVLKEILYDSNCDGFCSWNLSSLVRVIPQVGFPEIRGPI
jgi:hypothetical protein